MARRLGGLLSFLVAAAWFYRWEVVRAFLYERGFATVESLTLDQLVHYGVPVALVALGLFLFWKSGKETPRTENQAAVSQVAAQLPEADISARDAYYQILDKSEWREEQLRSTIDTTNLRRDWLEIRLSNEIHKALRNSRLAAWGEECLAGTVTTPEKPIPPDTWDTVQIVFDRAPQFPRTAAFFKGRVSFEKGRMAWVGVKFSSQQFFSLFPFSSVIDRIPCTTLLKLAENQGWDFSNDSLHLLDLQEAMRQGGLDNTLVIWGKEKKFSSDQLMQAEPLQKIEANHWKNHYVHLFAAREGDNFNTYSWLQTRDVGRRGYIDLHVSRSQAVLWLSRDAAGFKGKTKPR